MSVKPLVSKPGTNEAEAFDRFSESIPLVVKRIAASCNTGNSFDHISLTPIPSRESIVLIIHQVRRIIFPGYFSKTRLDPVNFEYCLGQEITELFENLSKQIVTSIQHDCLRYDQPCSQCTKYSRGTALQFIEALPEIRNVLASDTRAAFEGDPAAKTYDDVIFSYPGLFAITVYRIAHNLHEQKVPLLPRIITEYAHSLTGIDIHPGAKIGINFFIDHGTGVVVGETTEIGDRVRLYQGVTLGALSIPRHSVDNYRNKKRHPTIEDDVIIYSNATILGGKTVIGARSIIGGNVWITESVPPDTKVILKPPELIYIGNNTRSKRKSNTEKHK
jgi:serine O-acetyltransferase